MTIPYVLVPKNEYLAGNVRVKLDQAQTAAALDSRYEANIPLLEAVLPRNLDLSEICVNFSSAWIPTAYYEQFIWDVLSVRATVSYVSVTSAWTVKTTGNANTLANTSGYGMKWESVTYQTGRTTEEALTATDLIQMGLNLKYPVIKRRFSKGTSMARDHVLTAGALEKQRQLLDRFRNWLGEDPERKQQIESIYNRRLNHTALPTFDGTHLRIPGMTPSWRRKVRQYQRNAIYRGTLGNAGIFHEVGTGKTITIFGIVMERKRINPNSKAVILVKKSTLKQIGKTATDLYPNGNFLIASTDDCSDNKRQLFMARIATGNYDAVIMTHQQFWRLALKPETVRTYVNQLLVKVNDAIADNEATEEENQGRKRRKKSFIMKNLERQRNRLLEKLEKIQQSKDTGLYFEDLGINVIVADEADVYLNCPIQTKLQGVIGISQDPSDIATDFEWKAEWIRQTYGSGRLVLATGTPIRNTMVNLYVMQRLLQPEILEDRGIECFDAWVSMFAEVRAAAEVKATGDVARTNRLSEFVNLPELQQMFLSVADVVFYEDVKGNDLKRPTPKYVNVLCPMSDDQWTLMQDLILRAGEIKNNSPREVIPLNDDGTPKHDANGQIQKKLDNLLWVSTDGRKACLDPRLIDLDLSDFPKSKVNECVRRVFRIWRKTRKSQMIFLDLSTPNRNASFTVYQDIKMKLIDKGMSRDQIFFIQDFKTDDAKAWLFNRVNQGDCVILGSTEMMGVGVNCQEQLIALHHLDCPWRPCDLEQREGRIIRSGNPHERVLIYRYITQGKVGNCGFDAFMWQLVEVKLRFIRQILKGDMSIRRMEEDAAQNPTFSVGEVKALATGDDRLMRHVEVEALLDNQHRLQQSIRRDIYDLKHGWDSSLPWARRRLENVEEKLTQRSHDFNTVRNQVERCTGEHFAIRITDIDYTDRKAALKALEATAKELRDNKDLWNKWRTIGYFGGFAIIMGAVPSGNGESATVETYLRGRGTDYRVLYALQDGCRQFDSTYREILTGEQELLESRDRYRAKVAEYEAEIARKEAQLETLSQRSATLIQEKTALEDALGINKREAASEEIIGTDDDE